MRVHILLEEVLSHLRMLSLCSCQWTGPTKTFHAAPPQGISEQHIFYNSKSSWGYRAIKPCQCAVSPSSWVDHSAKEHFPIRTICREVIHHCTHWKSILSQMLIIVLQWERNTFHKPNDIVYCWFTKTYHFIKLLPFFWRNTLRDAMGWLHNHCALSFYITLRACEQAGSAIPKSKQKCLMPMILPK